MVLVGGWVGVQVRGKAGKYSDYSEHWARGSEQQTEMRHAPRTSQWTPHVRRPPPPLTDWQGSAVLTRGGGWVWFVVVVLQVCLLEFRSRLRQFVEERDWQRFHSVRRGEQASTPTGHTHNTH